MKYLIHLSSEYDLLGIGYEVTRKEFIEHERELGFVSKSGNPDELATAGFKVTGKNGVITSGWFHPEPIMVACQRCEKLLPTVDKESPEGLNGFTTTCPCGTALTGKYEIRYAGESVLTTIALLETADAI